jgi:hypothetical protein
MRKRLLLIIVLSALLGVSGRLWARPLGARALAKCPNTGCWVCWVNGEYQACCVYAGGSSCSLSDPYNCSGSSCS